MKKLLTIILVLSMLLCLLASCGDDETSSTSANSESSKAEETSTVDETSTDIDTNTTQETSTIDETSTDIDTNTTQETSTIDETSTKADETSTEPQESSTEPEETSSTEEPPVVEPPIDDKPIQIIESGENINVINGETYEYYEHIGKFLKIGGCDNKYLIFDTYEEFINFFNEKNDSQYNNSIDISQFTTKTFEQNSIVFIQMNMGNGAKEYFGYSNLSVIDGEVNIIYHYPSQFVSPVSAISEDYILVPKDELIEITEKEGNINIEYNLISLADKKIVSNEFSQPLNTALFFEKVKDAEQFLINNNISEDYFCISSETLFIYQNLPEGTIYDKSSLEIVDNQINIDCHYIRTEGEKIEKSPTLIYIDFGWKLYGKPIYDEYDVNITVYEHIIPNTEIEE